MKLHVIDESFTVCQIDSVQETDLTAPFTFLARTDEELSLVCPTEKVPANTLRREDGWRAFRIEGVLDFSLIGILARIADLLAEAGVGIFAVSTFNTDYILVKEHHLDQALHALGTNGYEII